MLMGAVTIRGGVMSPRIVLGAPPVAQIADGIVGPPLPATLGAEEVWRSVSRTALGWEFRLEVDFATVIQPIAPTAGGRFVYAAWVPSDARAGSNPVFAALAPVLVALGVLSAWWECDEIEGSLRPILDETPEADAVRAAWPATWRVRLDTDDPEGPPTGALILGTVLA